MNSFLIPRPLWTMSSQAVDWSANIRLLRLSYYIYLRRFGA